ncbi:MAG TPA: hypothetical protein VHI13_18210 [Candidatus Kapabacteria bacterium]|nr:hypothetical protein [Candidatus Kapabacteria bacterium]
MVVVRAKGTIALMAVAVFVLGASTLRAQLPPGKFSGIVFGDYAYNVGRDSTIGKLPNTALTGPKDFQAFQLRRIYFTYDQDISESFTSRFRLEADQEANASNGKIGVFVKDAYLKWKNVFSGSDVTFGIQPTPTFDVSEGAWGYRSLEKTIMDLRGIAPSRDIGVSLRGKFDDKGMFGYWVMVGDGTGNKPEVDKYKRYYAQLQARPVEGMVIDLYTDLNARPNIVDSNNVADRLGNDANTYALFIGYSSPNQYSFGVEAFMQSTQNAVLTGRSPFTYRSRSIMGGTVYGSYFFVPKLAGVVRFDYYDPDNDASATGDKRNLIIAGLDWRPEKNVSIIPNIEMETYETPASGRSIDPSLTARLTVSYQFP